MRAWSERQDRPCRLASGRGTTHHFLDAPDFFPPLRPARAFAWLFPPALRFDELRFLLPPDERFDDALRFALPPEDARFDDELRFLLPPLDDLFFAPPDFLPPRLEAPGLFAMAAARPLLMPFLRSPSYCSSFFTDGP